MGRFVPAGGPREWKAGHGLVGQCRALENPDSQRVDFHGLCAKVSDSLMHTWALIPFTTALAPFINRLEVIT